MNSGTKLVDIMCSLALAAIIAFAATIIFVGPKDTELLPKVENRHDYMYVGAPDLQAKFLHLVPSDAYAQRKLEKLGLEKPRWRNGRYQWRR